MPGVRLLLPLVAALALAVTPGAAFAAGRCGTHPWCDTSLSPERRADLLLGALTPAERLGLLGGDDIKGVLGGAHAHTGTQDGVPRLDVPTVFYTDGPQGPRQGRTTGLPSPLGLAATWSPAAARAYGAVVGAEARDKGNDVVFGPVVNLLRTPLNGRTFEGYGEDPLLTARMAVGWIRGAQAQGVIGDVKHFAANNQEGVSPLANTSRPGQLVGPTATRGSRFKVDVRVAERTLHELELRGFEAAVRDAGVGTVMCSYNKLGGTYACENPGLLTGVLGGWGFKGFVLADYGAVHSVAPSLRAGLAFEPWPGSTLTVANVQAAIDAGELTRAQADDAVRRMLRTFFAFGVFDRQAFRDDDAQIPRRAHARTARRLAEQATTLLVNRRGTLPLRAGRLRSIAVLGAGSDRFVTGGGSGNVTPFRVTTLQSAVRAQVGRRVRVRAYAGRDRARAVRLARRSDVAVVATPDYLTEGVDRACLTLECPPVYGDQDALIAAVAKVNPRTVVVLQTGGPVLTPWRGRVGALLESWYPGQEGGAAIARVLFGAAEPGGRLPATFPRRASQLPTAGDPRRYPGVEDVEAYAEGLLAGHRWYDAKGLRPAFPFGFGLTWTTFGLGRPVARAAGGGRVAVAVPVRNTGRRPGTAVVQLYLAHPKRSGEPPRQLVGFTRVRVGRGGAVTARVRLDRTAFRTWDARRHAWVVRPGRYRLWAGTSSRDLGRAVGLRVG